MSDAWYAAFLLLTLLSLANAVLLIAVMRQVGVLHMRVRPTGPGRQEGPVPGSRLPRPTLTQVGGNGDWAAREDKLSIFAYISPGCELCTGLVESVHRLRPQASECEFAFITEAGADDARRWASMHKLQAPLLRHSEIVERYSIPGSPYVIALKHDASGDDVVVGAGVVNTLEQLEDLVSDARHNSDDKTPVVRADDPLSIVSVGLAEAMTAPDPQTLSEEGA